MSFKLYFHLKNTRHIAIKVFINNDRSYFEHNFLFNIYKARVCVGTFNLLLARRFKTARITYETIDCKTKS